MGGLTERRIGLLFAIFLAMLAIAGGRTLWLGGVKASALQRAAATQQVNEIDVPATRGAISDRNGIELAVSEPAADVAATPYLIKRPLRAAARLAPLLTNSTQADVLKKLSTKSGFVYLARNLPAARVEQIKALKIDGLQFIPTARREYPRRHLASQVIGGVGVDGNGLSGLEFAHDDILHGVNGKRRIVKDGVGEPIELRETKRAVAGKDVRLTLDAQLQRKVEDVLAEVGAAWHPKGATAIAMDPRTNRVLALANWPRVDANDLGGAPDYAAQNRAVGFNYEPGSTFKAFTVAGALEDRAVTPNDYFHLPPTIEVADRTIEEPHVRGTVDLTTSEILAQSSNVGTVRIGQRLGATRFDRWVRRFGFGRRTGIELAGEESGQVLKRKDYSGSSMGNLPIGQGESVTPLQLATGYSAIANGGDPAPAADRRPRRRPADARRRPDGASSPSGPRSRCARCSAASSRPAARRRRRRSTATRSPARRARPTRSTARPACTPRRATSHRSPASHRRATRRSWSRSWSTSRRARSTAPRSRRRPSRRSCASRCRTCASPPAEPGRSVRRIGAYPPAMRLREVFGDAIADDPPVEVGSLALDHRRVEPGSVFFCVRGFTRDGHEFAADAVERGAVALVVDHPLGLGVPEVVVDDVRAAMAPAAARLHGDPTATLSVIGVTGTNGKTTTAYLVRALLEAAGASDGAAGDGEVGHRRRRARGCAHHPGGDRPAGGVRRDARRRRHALRDGGLQPRAGARAAPTRSTGRRRSSRT